MFGVVPKPLWSQTFHADERNRIGLDTNCLLIRSGGKNILVDTGYGGKAPDKVRQLHALEPGEPLLHNLASEGVAPQEIDFVILTHLHFDHAGGGTRFAADGSAVPTFPKAKYIVQRAEWEDATADRPELAGAYFRKDFEPLEAAGQLEIVEGNVEIAPGVSAFLVGGHTRGMQLVVLQQGEREAVFLADLAPTAAHLRPFWTMAYDQNLLDVRRSKPAVLGRMCEHDAVALFEHDPVVWGGRIRRDDRQGFVLDKPVSPADVWNPPS